MIDSLRGILRASGENLILSAGPVSFLLHSSQRSRDELLRESGAQEVFVTLLIREDRMELVAFARRDERDLYRILTAISGVGTRLALSILSTLSVEELAGAVRAGDERLLSTVPGVGRKKASRLLLELKDRLESFLPADLSATVSSAKGDPRREEVLMALEGLGIPRTEAARLFDTLPRDENLPVEGLIREALKAGAKV
ncbi:MAG: Holliday junction branch migration protein RuvA [Candidatus Krumholzibacteria bacterium]|jgi:Holliday junction DNA helicase RuvA|nr:Holliday junction branch migration protein RuvA [Candidatus Krumholzibacteria bacterium]MDP7021074.1 Holliday junction branch migration protein RuvA [Candidatus Krumholzibacteria bacterium]